MASTNSVGTIANKYALLPVLAIGGLLGYVLSGDIFSASTTTLAAHFAVGVVGGLLLLRWAGMISMALELKRAPAEIPYALENQDLLNGELGETPPRGELDAQVRRILQLWTQGWTPQQIAMTSDLEMSHNRQTSAGEFLAALLLLVAAHGYAGTLVTLAGVVLLAITFLARLNLDHRIFGYVSERVLPQIPANIPNTAMTAAQLASALGASIEKSFRDYVPQPEQLAAVIRSSLAETMNETAANLKDLNQSLVASQGSTVQTWTEAAKGAAAELDTVQKSMFTALNELTQGLKGAAAQVSEGLSGNTAEIKQAFAEAGVSLKDSAAGNAGQLEETLSRQAQVLAQTNESWIQQLKSVLDAHTKTIEDATQCVSGQLQKIQELAGNIENILHIQQTVENTLQTVSTSEQFEKTMSALQKHIEASDDLLREIAKPRTIRLVESDEDYTEASVAPAEIPPVAEVEPPRKLSIEAG